MALANLFRGTNSLNCCSSFGKIDQIINGASLPPSHFCTGHHRIGYNDPVLWRKSIHFNSLHILKKPNSNLMLCQLSDRISSENEEYRSSRNIAITLLKRYRNFVVRGGNANLKEFLHAGVNAYALGCTDEGIRKELNNMKDSGFEVDSMHEYSGNTRVKSRIIALEIDECVLWLSILFITILSTPPPTIIRWSSVSPVSSNTLLHWKGFCAVIANAYFMRGMAWLPVKTLQLEQLAVTGQCEEPAIVASRMSLVFSTLEELVIEPLMAITEDYFEEIELDDYHFAGIKGI